MLSECRDRAWNTTEGFFSNKVLQLSDEMRVEDVKDHTSKTNKNSIHPENNSLSNGGVLKVHHLFSALNW